MKTRLALLTLLSLAAIAVSRLAHPPVVSAATSASETVSFRPRVFPNPWKVDRDDARGMTFDQFPAGSTVKIFTVAAEKVRVLKTSTSDLLWDLKNQDGDHVASGVYLYTVTAPSGETARGKLVIIR